MNKLRLYKFLGAEFFQKVVFKVEKLKYNIMKRIPNIEEKIDFLIDKQADLAIWFNKDKREEYEEKRKFSKMRYRKELYSEKNNNYHCSMEYPIEFIRQLEFNKKIHMSGIKINIGSLLALFVGSFIFSISLPIMVLLTLYQVICLVVNFECVNLQNYNLERFNNERLQQKFKIKTVRSYQNNYKKYGHASDKIEKLVKKSSTIPSVSDTIGVMETVEEKSELLALAQKQKKKLALTRKEG